MFPYVVADIGGTNARYGLVTGEQNNIYDISAQVTFNCSDFENFGDSLQAYFDHLDHTVFSDGQRNGKRSELVKFACVAIAGPVSGDQVKMTNLNWVFSIADVESRFGLQKLEVINDFTAQACAINHLSEKDLLPIKSVSTSNECGLGNKAILGPGTGLGVAGLVKTPAGYFPVAGEGGHVDLAPRTEKEIQILQSLQQQLGHVSAETLLCGPGLLSLYGEVVKLNGRASKCTMPDEVTRNALAQSDEDCEEALSIFCALLGSFAGNVALTLGARGGVYLSGGILPQVREFLMKSDFVNRFKSKGAMSGFVNDVSVSLITHDQPALIGAAAWLTDCCDCFREDVKENEITPAHYVVEKTA